MCGCFKKKKKNAEKYRALLCVHLTIVCHDDDDDDDDDDGCDFSFGILGHLF